MIKGIVTALITFLLFFSQTLFADNYPDTFYEIADVSFDISEAVVESDEYNGEVQNPRVVYDGNLLQEGVDYEIEWADGLGQCKNAGSYKLTLIGKGIYANSVKTEYKIFSKKITPQVILENDTYVYSGGKILPEVEAVKDGENVLDNNSYKIISAPANYFGFYTVEVKLVGNYSGTGSATFKVVPRSVKSIKVKGKKKRKLEVTWKNHKAKNKKARVTGFVVELSKQKDFSSDTQKCATKGYKKTKKIVAKLKKKTRYYVHVRTYKKVGDDFLYSAWSKVKSAITK